MRLLHHPPGPVLLPGKCRELVGQLRPSITRHSLNSLSSMPAQLETSLHDCVAPPLQMSSNPPDAAGHEYLCGVGDWVPRPLACHPWSQHHRPVRSLPPPCTQSPKACAQLSERYPSTGKERQCAESLLLRRHAILLHALVPPIGLLRPCLFLPQMPARGACAALATPMEVHSCRVYGHFQLNVCSSHSFHKKHGPAVRRVCAIASKHGMQSRMNEHDIDVGCYWALGLCQSGRVVAFCSALRIGERDVMNRCLAPAKHACQCVEQRVAALHCWMDKTCSFGLACH